ncbi:MAG: hypothetical protein C1943_15820 [Halochromatium sp.]|nr:hypothetical protein [Halochromatium sp.]
MLPTLKPNLQRLQLKLWVGVGLALLIAFTLMQISRYRSAHEDALTAALIEAESVSRVLMDTQRVYQRLFEERFGDFATNHPALLPAHVLARVAREMHKRDSIGAKVNIVTRDNRHSSSQPTPIEAAAMRHFEMHPDQESLVTPFTQGDGRKRYHYAQPLWIKGDCLSCHGNPSRLPEQVLAFGTPPTGYTLGDLRGILSISLPQAQILQHAADDYWTSLGQHLLIFLTLFIAGGVLLQWFVIRKVQRLRSATRALAHGDYQVRVPVHGKDELADLGRSFNRMADSIALRDRRLRDAQARAKLGFWTLDPATKQGDWSDEVYRILGLPPTATASLETFIGVIHPDDRSKLLATIEQSLASLSGHELDCRLQRPNGEQGWINCQAATLLDTQGRLVQLEGIVQDISSRKQALAAVDHERQFLQHIIDGIEDSTLVIRPDYSLIRMNRSARAIALAAGLSEEGLSCHQVSHQSTEPCSGDDHPCPLEQVLKTGQACKVVHYHLDQHGQKRTVEVAASPLRDEQDQIIGVIENARDISDQLALLEQLKEQKLSYAHLAQHDPLTGLPNRLLFTDRLSQAILRAQRDQYGLAILLIDLDHFKHINDSFDHSSGDQVLQEVAARLRALFRAADTIARLDGDEFGVILSEIKPGQEAALVAHKILQSFEEPFYIRGRQVFLAASIGIALYPEHGTSVDDLVRNADTALNRAKDQGRNSFHYYSAELTAKAFERVMLESSLRQALGHQELVLHYQPQIQLATGTIHGVEALLRWRQPEAGLISPAQFIPIAEESGLILPIGEWVLREGVRQMKVWQAQGLATPTTLMSVNLSAKQFRQPDLIDMIQSILTDANLDPSGLELEITESIMMAAPELASQRLSRLRKLGVKVAIDDFGTGYSSLGYLKSLPLTKLKIDRSFVSDIPHDNNDIVITRAVIGLARSLSLEVVAEGVETEAQRDFLISEGCPIVQGYLFSKPLPGKSLADFLRARRSGSALP